MLLDAIAETIERYRMFESGQRVGVAVSGGADSVCLLHALRELASRWDLRVAVLHVNHGLRGEESCEDERFVRQLAAGIGFDSLVRAVDLSSVSDNLEQAARQVRLEFFREQIAAGRVDRVATGHNRNDQAETVLFRFLRGAGGAGLAAIRPVTTDGLVRPLLAVTRPEIEQFLRDRGIGWREDGTNRSDRFARNRIRHQLLPQLARDWNPAIVENLNRTADWALAEEEYWEHEIARLAKVILTVRTDGIVLAVKDLCELPRAAARRLVRHTVGCVKGDLRGLEFDHVAAILQLASFRIGHGRVEAPGVEVERSLDWLRFAAAGAARSGVRDYHLAVPVPGEVPVPGGPNTISLELIEKAETSDGFDCVYNSETGWVNWRTLSGPLEIRNWRPGDQYQPQGSTGEVRIKSLFQKARIPRWERRHWPVLTDGSAIVWTRRFGPAMRFAAEPGCALVLRIREAGDWRA